MKIMRHQMRFSKLWIVGMGFCIFSAWGMKAMQDNKWVAPASADKLVNPVKGDASAVKAGEVLYTKMCAICHGNKGKGDGMAGMSLNPRPSNFTKTSLQEQSDGALFWKLTTGRSPMAGYEKILKEEQRWQLVNYIRTFKK